MTSPLNSSFELGRRLVAAGHRVTYLSQADIQSQVEANGFPFKRLVRDLEYRDRRALEMSPWQDGWFARPGEILAWLRRCRRIRREFVAEREIEERVEELKPDLLLIDNEMHFAIIAAAGLAVPVMLQIMWFSIFRDPALPPMQFKMPPPKGPAGRLAVLLAWWRTRLATVRIEWLEQLSPRGIAALFAPFAYDTVNYAELKAVARSHRYRLRREVSRRHWLRPFTYRHLPVLCLNLQEMDFPHQPHRNLHYVGPMVRRQRHEARMDPVSRQRWAALAKERQQGRNAQRPLIYCSLGSYWRADTRILQNVIAVLNRRKDWDLVLGLGKTLSPESLGPLPPNVTLLEWAPQLEVLEQASCAITHGGIATINECISCEVPMVVYSTGHVDQPGCTARVVYHGLGIAADENRDGVDDLERHLEQVLSDPRIQQNVSAMRKRLDAAESRNLAVELIEKAIGNVAQSAPSG